MESTHENLLLISVSNMSELFVWVLVFFFFFFFWMLVSFLWLGEYTAVVCGECCASRYVDAGVRMSSVFV